MDDEMNGPHDLGWILTIFIRINRRPTRDTFIHLLSNYPAVARR